MRHANCVALVLLLVACFSVSAVCAVDDPPPPTLAELTGQLKDPTGTRRAEAARMLGERGAVAESAVPALIALFEDQDPTGTGEPVWHVAAEAVGKLGPASLPTLISLLSGDSVIRRHAAAVAIHTLGAAGKPAVGKIVEELGRNNPESRISLIYALMGIGPEAGPAVPALIKMLGADDFHTQYWACRALGRIGLPAAKSAIPPLIELLKNPVASVRGNAAAALGQLGPDVAPETVSPLTEALGDKLYNVRRAAAESLGKIGPPAKSAVPALDKCLANENFAAHCQAAVARYHITSELEPTITVLLDQLQKRDAPWDAAEGFEQIGAPAHVATDRLIALLESPLSETRVFAASSLSSIGPAARTSLPKLRELLKDQDEDVREVAAEAIKILSRE